MFGILCIVDYSEQENVDSSITWHVIIIFQQASSKHRNCVSNNTSINCFQPDHLTHIHC